MKKLFFIIFLLTFNIYASQIKIASYNVENLFDLTKQNSEYSEYIPNTKSNWNHTTYTNKLNNILRVIKDIDADIIALQEIENKNVLIELFKRLPQYKYYSFSKYSRSAVGVGFLSKIKIVENKQIDVKFPNKTFRPILESTFEIENIRFKIFNNHWPSKAVDESFRIKYAKILQETVKKLPRDYDYILLGDFNSNYDEMISFKNNKKLNTTQGITGINHILNTIYTNETFVNYNDILQLPKVVHFNLWLDLTPNERFSSKFKNQYNTPDNIIVNSALFDNKKLSYIPNSFNVFKASYLFRNNQLFRWDIKNNKHLGNGYSDHLPIYALFSINKNDRNSLNSYMQEYENKKHFNISDLYSMEKLNEPITLKEITVIYKNSDMAIIKDKSRAIYIYKNAKNLKLGFNYDLLVNQIETYNGLKEIKSFSIKNENHLVLDYEKLYLKSENIDILNDKYQNEIVTNLKGVIKGNKLFFQRDKYINLYAKNKDDLPKNETVVEFLTAHISTYKGNKQILIHSKNDYKVVQ